MTDRSFEKFNYGLRPNKSVERKMIFHSLRELEPQFSISAYKYIGFGSLWFVDFLLAHRELRISDLTSMEVEHSRTKRVEFNRPLRCIDVVMQSAADALPALLTEKRAVVWLDYDGGLKAALSGDLEISLGKLPLGSFFLVTVNAEYMQLQRTDEDGELIPAGAVLAELTGDEGWAERTKELNRRGFPGVVGKLLLDRLQSIVLQYRPGLEFTPIWNFVYADDATMVTVGGMVGDQAARDQLARADLRGRFGFITAPDQYAIELPVLTRREKLEFDRWLPSSATIPADELPFELKQKEIDAYIKYYKYYPIYDELAS